MVKEIFFAAVTLVLAFFTVEYFILLYKTRKQKSLLKTKAVLTLKAVSNLFMHLSIIDLEKETCEFLEGDEFRSISYQQFIDEICRQIKQHDDAVELAVLLNKKNIRKSFSDEIEYLRYEFELQDESPLWTHLIIFKLEEKDGEITKLLFTMQDITAVKAEEQQYHEFLKETTTASQRANDAKNIFLANMSHDIRTPMNQIIGMTELAHIHIDDVNLTSEYLNKIDDASKQLLEILNELLELTKIESGTMTLKSEKVNLPVIIDNIFTQFLPQIRDKKLKFKANIENVTNEFFISDKIYIEQILGNLIENSIKYTQSGGTVTLHINEKTETSQGKSTFEFIVEDTGIGIETETLNHIFEPFYRKDEKRTSKVAGTGIGLTIVQELVQRMNGSVMVESHLGSGTKFSVTIPVKIIQDEEPESNSLKGKKVIFADSDTLSLESAFIMSRLQGAQADIVTTLEDLKQKLTETETEYTAVIISKNLAISRNHNLIKPIKEELGSKFPPLIVSGYDITKAEDYIKKLNADGFISKPFFPSKIAEVLNNISKKRSRQSFNQDYKNKTVLIAEDNSMNAEIAKGLLEMLSVKVDIAQDGCICLQKLNKNPDNYYSMVFMDIKMPNLDGYATTEEIRKSEREYIRNIPIVAVTANSFEDDIQKSLSAGMNDHIAKPLDIKKLLKALEKYCN